MNDLQTALDAKSNLERVVSAARVELTAGAKPNGMKRATLGAKRRQLEMALDMDAVTAATIDVEAAASQVLTNLDPAGLERIAAGNPRDLERMFTGIRARLQRLLDARASEATAWKVACQHTEAELKDALLDAEGQRARLSAVSAVLERKADDDATRGVA